MNDEYKEYCVQAAKLGAESLGMFKELTKDRIETAGNKCNGTQDRQQAFGSLF